MSALSDVVRMRWRETWRTTICELDQDGAWLDFARAVPAEPTLLITAWNPGGSRIAEALNIERDAALRAELIARGMSPRRARGRSPDRSWHEDGWAVRYDRDVAVDLLLRHGQLAGFVFERGGRGLIWREGTFDWLDAPP